jgi:GR25 family glycosyltransferase involved in LPS biosynthesis
MNIFHKSYYVNLDYRQDRRKKIEHQLSKIPLLSKTERFPAIDGKKINYKKEKLLGELYETKRSGFKLGKSLTPGLVGLHKTFLEIYKKNINKDYGNILIIEDDCVFIDDFEEKFNECIKHIPKDWDMISFGYITEDLVIKEKINDFYSTYEYKPGTQCFMVNKKACKVFLKHLKYPKMAVDADMTIRVVRKGLLNAYITNQRLAYQIDDSDTDTVPRSDKKFYYN